MSTKIGLGSSNFLSTSTFKAKMGLQNMKLTRSNIFNQITRWISRIRYSMTKNLQRCSLLKKTKMIDFKVKDLLERDNRTNSMEPLLGLNNRIVVRGI